MYTNQYKLQTVELSRPNSHHVCVILNSKFQILNSGEDLYGGKECLDTEMDWTHLILLYW